MKQYTRWLALYQYGFAAGSYIIFARKNKKNGMFQFRTKRINRLLADCSLNINLDTKERFTSLEKEQ